MNPSPAEVAAGQAVYSPTVLKSYDLLVLGISNRWIWKCPTPRLLEFYNQQVTGNHLDVGVGTGYFLDRCQFPERPRIGLVDLNKNCLSATARRIERYQPTTWKRNILEPLELDAEPFQSIGVNYLIHCLPGTLATKCVLFDHLLPHLEPRGIIFGSTIFGTGVPRSWLARQLMATYNRKGIFTNLSDHPDQLRQELSQRFAESEVQIHGCVGLFWGRKR